MNQWVSINYNKECASTPAGGKSMTENDKYVELLWYQKYDKIELGENMPAEKPNLPFQVMEALIAPVSRPSASLERRWKLQKN